MEGDGHPRCRVHREDRHLGRAGFSTAGAGGAGECVAAQAKRRHDEWFVCFLKKSSPLFEANLLPVLPGVAGRGD